MATPDPKTPAGGTQTSQAKSSGSKPSSDKYSAKFERVFNEMFSGPVDDSWDSDSGDE